MEICGIGIEYKDWMPEGWFAFKTDKGALCCGPNGTIWVPFHETTTPA